MKKISKIFIAFVVIGSTATLPACKKCMECDYDYKKLHGSHYDDEHVHEKKCGSSKELQQFEEGMQAEAKSHGTTATCYED